MKTSNKGVELIKRHEGFVPHAYKCPAGIWTIGYGHTGGVNSGDVITKQEGEKLLLMDVQTAERAVNRQNLKLTQNQFDALVSFVFNIGEGRDPDHPRGPAGFRGSTLLRKLKVDTNDPTIGSEFRRWDKARQNGVLKSLPGLTRRRNEEANLYFSE